MLVNLKFLQTQPIECSGTKQKKWVYVPNCDVHFCVKKRPLHQSCKEEEKTEDFNFPALKSEVRFRPEHK